MKTKIDNLIEKLEFLNKHAQKDIGGNIFLPDAFTENLETAKEMQSDLIRIKNELEQLKENQTALLKANHSAYTFLLYNVGNKDKVINNLTERAKIPAVEVRISVVYGAVVHC